MKSIVLSFDDGTIYDCRFIEILNKYNISATFNLNSKLDDFVWYYKDKPVRRLKLNECVDLYKGHEVASHTLTHPYLTSLTKEELIKEVKEDVENLSKIFGYEIVSFGTPFSMFNEEVIKTINENTNLKYLRLSKFTNDTKPNDPSHIFLNVYFDDKDIFNKIDDFINNSDDKGMFIIVGHSYEFELDNKWDVIENLVKYLSNVKGVKVETFKEACKRYFE